ncbi:MAG TPA: carboxypeptidase regulatory-like domain-containing protein [Armatimonadota bacterium]|nr:carboxypeptidase regulatory-like domain-containing protein [Armatimonadota bacterium]
MEWIIAFLLLLLAFAVRRTEDFERPFLFGTQVIDEGRLDEMLGLLSKYGGTQSRVGVCWLDNEKVRGQRYDFSRADEEVRLHLKHGLSVLLNLATVPYWASEAPPEALKILNERGHTHLAGTLMISPNHTDDYVRWVEAVAKHFGDRTEYYEIWNEPDGMAGPIIHYDDEGKLQDVWYGGDPAALTRVLKAAYTTLHRCHPGCTVVACSLESKTAFLQGIYEAGGKGYFDAVSIHPYGEPGEPLLRRWIQEVRDLMVSQGDGDKGIWITEYAWGFADRPGPMLEAIRWGRENPYIAALHVHLANHLFENYEVGAGPLKPTPGLIAFKQAVEEKGPRESCSYDFEAGLPIEWRLPPDQTETSELASVSSPVHGGKRALRAASQDRCVTLICNAYVKDHNSTLSFWFVIPSGDNGKGTRLEVTTTPATPIYGADKTTILHQRTPLNQWVRQEIKLADIDPNLSGSTLMNVTISAISDAPGVSLVLDDFSITPGHGPLRPRPRPTGSIQGIVRDYLDRLGLGAKVVLQHESRASIDVTYGDDGVFALQALEPGEYRVSAQADGCERFATTVSVLTGIVTKLPIYLNPAFNMVRNPGFEEGDQCGVGASWETTCGGPHPEIYDVTDLASHSGERSQRMSCEGYNFDTRAICFHDDPKTGEKVFHPAHGIALRSQAISQVIEGPITPGEEYRLSAWVRIQRLVAHWEWLRLSVQWLDENGKLIGESRESDEDRANIDRHDWKLITARGVAPKGTAKARIWLHHHFEHGVVWYDDVCFAKIEDTER